METGENEHGYGVKYLGWQKGGGLVDVEAAKVRAYMGVELGGMDRSG